MRSNRPRDRFLRTQQLERRNRERDTVYPQERAEFKTALADAYREPQLQRIRDILASGKASLAVEAWVEVLREWMEAGAQRRRLFGQLARTVAILAKQCELAEVPRSVVPPEKERYYDAASLRAYLFDADGRRQRARDASRAPWMSDRSLLPKAPPGRRSA